MTVYACPACRTSYTVTRNSEPSSDEPRCLECDELLPDQNGDEWLHYRRNVVVARFKDD